MGCLLSGVRGHDLPPTTNQGKKEKQHKSSYIQVPTFWSLPAIYRPHRPTPSSCHSCIPTTKGPPIHGNSPVASSGRPPYLRSPTKEFEKFTLVYKEQVRKPKPLKVLPETKLYYTILYYTILYYTILYYTILYYTILYYTILFYTILYYTILYYTILYYTILYYTILYYTILYYTILYRTIPYHTIL